MDHDALTGFFDLSGYSCLCAFSVCFFLIKWKCGCVVIAEDLIAILVPSSLSFLHHTNNFLLAVEGGANFLLTARSYSCICSQSFADELSEIICRFCLLVLLDCFFFLSFFINFFTRKFTYTIISSIIIIYSLGCFSFFSSCGCCSASCWQRRFLRLEVRHLFEHHSELLKVDLSITIDVNLSDDLLPDALFGG